jgi:hypothetical protein
MPFFIQAIAPKKQSLDFFKRAFENVSIPLEKGGEKGLCKTSLKTTRRVSGSGK